MFYGLTYNDIKSNGRFNETCFPTNDIVFVVGSGVVICNEKRIILHEINFQNPSDEIVAVIDI